MGEMFAIENFMTLGMLIFLQAVLGFDNLLYISLESKRVAPEKQQMVRRLGIAFAIILRLVLLFVVIKAISAFQAVIPTPNFGEWFHMELTGHALIVLAGGVFIIYTAFKEITHMLSVHDLHHDVDKAHRSPAVAITWIMVMNVVFSFDSILSAIALTEVFWVMACAIVVSGILMIVMADRVAVFLERNRMYEVLGLFILLLVGVMLVSEGGHLAKLEVAGYHIDAMSKSTFYFVLVVLVLVDVVQSRYQKKINIERAQQVAHKSESPSDHAHS